MSIEQARARFDRIPFANFLGITITELSHERARLTLPYCQTHMNAVGVLNGGASASLLNMAGTLAAWTGINLDTEPRLGCVDLSIQYLAAPGEEDVLAEARVLRRGRDLFFLDVALQNRSGDPLCHGLMIYRSPNDAGHIPRVQSQPELLAAPDPLNPLDDPWVFQGYVTKLDITPLHQTPGRTRLHMPCTAMHGDEKSRLHEGALASLVDVAGISAIWSLIPDRQGCRGSTVGMQIAYPGTTAEAVVADAHVQQRSEESFFSTVHVTTATSRRLVAMGQVIYRLLEPR